MARVLRDQISDQGSTLLRAYLTPDINRLYYRSLVLLLAG